MLVSHLPAVCFSPSTAKKHLNIFSEVPKHTSLSPYPLCSDRWQNSQLHKGASKPLTQSGNTIKSYGKGSHVPEECLSV